MRFKLLIILVFAVAVLITQSGCEDLPTETCDEDTTHVDTSHVIVYKPNIYIYPTEQIDLSVNITFPLDGRVTESIPQYNTGWNVSVEPTGIIDGKYKYLFYECSIPNYFQKSTGWVVEQNNLKLFFKTNLSSHGFSENEIRDFTDYWIPKLDDSKYYEVYPQYSSDIEKMIVLNFSNKPENIFRLFYYIKGRDNNNIDIAVPTLAIGKRESYYVMEWGVIIP